MKRSKETSLPIPPGFLDRMAGLLGEQYPAFLASLQSTPITGLRVNTLKITTSEMIAMALWSLEPLAWCPSGFSAAEHSANPSRLSPGKHPYHSAGLYYLQEPSAMAVAEVLAPQIGETVLDLAAAPGGKTTHLAALMHNSGLLVANEIHPKRVWDLVENLERCGVTNAIVTQETPQNLATSFGESFDCVLLDAPCSGEGMFRKGDIARQEWSSEMARSCALRQMDILVYAAQMVKPAGRLLYSTCTFSPDENEGVLARFLSGHPDFDLAAIQHIPGFSPAHPEWLNQPATDRLQRAIRIWPHLAPAEGTFIALLVRHASSMRDEPLSARKAQSRQKKSALSDLAKKTLTGFTEFCHANLSVSFDPTRLVLAGDCLYQLPELAPDLSGVHVIRRGWLLGRIQNGHFTPSHHLAMGMSREQAQHQLNLDAADPRLAAYLRGETFIDPGVGAWVLVCVDGYSLGWAKRVHNVIKNHYPHGLRNRS